MNSSDDSGGGVGGLFADNNTSRNSGSGGSSNGVEMELNRSGVFMPKIFLEPEELPSKRDRETRNFRYIPPAPRPQHVRSVPTQARLLHSRNESKDLDSSFQLLMPNPSSGGSTASGLFLNNGPQASHGTYFRQYFEIQERLGFGSFGDVFRAKSLVDGLQYAVKKSRRTYAGEGDRSRQLHEVQRVVHIPSNRHLVELEKAWEEGGHLYLQMELCAKSLNSHIEEGNLLSEDEAWNVTVDILLALQHLHKYQLVHMDVKPENIFLTMDSPPVYKLGDFGIVVSLLDKRDITDFSEGDSRYLAPEVMQGYVSTKADVFSMGLTILEMSCHVDLPKGGKLWHRLRSGEALPDGCMKEMPKSMENLIKAMIAHDPNNRPDIDAILKFPEVQAAMQKRRWPLGIVYIKQRFSGIWRLWNFLLSFLASLVAFTPRRHSTSDIPDPLVTPEYASIEKSLILGPPEISITETSFSDDEELPINSSRNTTPVYASTPISHTGTATRSGGRMSLRSRRGDFDSYKIPGSPSTSRNLLKEFEAVSSSDE